MAGVRKARRGIPKGDKRERTRAALIEAAAKLIGERGYEETTLEAVAESVGMSRGAIYGNFKNREDLLLAVVESRWKPAAPPLKPGASFKRQMRILAEAIIASIPARQKSAVGAASFQVYALTHEKMRKRIVKANAEIYRRFAQSMVEVIPEKDLPMPPERFIRVLHALSDGLLMLRFLTPELISDEDIIAAFEALA
ncbi:MAG: helix-turn-helix domain-containing protein [Alphaproteobacteria bacterium]